MRSAPFECSLPITRWESFWPISPRPTAVPVRGPNLMARRSKRSGDRGQDDVANQYQPGCRHGEGSSDGGLARLCTKRKEELPAKRIGSQVADKYGARQRGYVLQEQDQRRNPDRQAEERFQ